MANAPKQPKGPLFKPDDKVTYEHQPYFIEDSVAYISGNWYRLKGRIGLVHEAELKKFVVKNKR